jgi:hypothetical protein
MKRLCFLHDRFVVLTFGAASRPLMIEDRAAVLAKQDIP